MEFFRGKGGKVILVAVLSVFAVTSVAASLAPLV